MGQISSPPSRGATPAATLLALALALVIGACTLSTVQTPNTPTPTSTSTPTPKPTATPVPQAKVIAVFSTPVAVAPNGTGTASASCANGTTLVSGGYIIRFDNVNGDDGLPADDSYPSSNNTWTVARTEPVLQSMHVEAIATCVQANFPITTQIVNSAATQNGVTSVGCPAGTVLTGGGFQSGGGRHAASQPKGNGWQVTTGIPFGGTANPIAYAICASRGLKVGSVQTFSKTVGANAVDGGAAQCPAGQLPVGGGHNGYPPGGDTFWWVFIDGPYTGQGVVSIGWNIEVHSGIPAPQTLAVYAVCDGF